MGSAVLGDRKNFRKLHAGWFFGTSLVLLLCVAWEIEERRRWGHWPGGGSWSGLCFGLIAASIFLFEFLLWPRRSRRFRTSRGLGSAQTWMKAHIWLGLLSAPLVLLHSGGRFGGWYTWWLAWLSIAVIASGIFGLLMQNVLPRLLLEYVDEETVHAQIDRVAQQLADEALLILELHVADFATVSPRVARNPRPEAIYLGRDRPIGAMRQPTVAPERERPRPIKSEVLVAASEIIDDYLRTGDRSGELLGTRQKNSRYFEELSQRVTRELRPAVRQIESLCERRRQFELQRRIDWWLRSWLVVHVPLSTALMVLLAGHVVLALRIG